MYNGSPNARSTTDSAFGYIYQMIKRFQAVLFCLVFVCFSKTEIQAQTDFCVPGATWLYALDGNFVNNSIQSRIEYIGDTLFTDIVPPVKILRDETRWQSFSGGQVTTNFQRYYIRLQGDSVLYYSEGNWEFAFEFNVLPNDSRITRIGGAPDCSPLDTMRIEAVEILSYFGLSLSAFHYRLIQAHEISLEGGLMGTAEGVYYERIGHAIDHPVVKQVNCYQEANATEYMPKNLICYTDEEIDNLDSTAGCPFTLFPLSSNSMSRMEMNCNYVNGMLRMNGNWCSYLTVHDALGRELHHSRLKREQAQVNLPPIPSGVILISCYSFDGNVLRKRFLHGL